MRTDIITIGTEYLTGMIRETDSSYLAGRLAELDAELVNIIITGDDPEDLRKLLDYAFEDVDMVIVTGASGYGKDPVYHRVFAERFSVSTAFDEAASGHMKQKAAERGLRVAEDEIRALAVFPSSSRVLINHAGLCCGYILSDGIKHLIVLPGGSDEIRQVFEDDAVGYIYRLTSLGEAEVTVDINDIPGCDDIAGNEQLIIEKLGELMETDNPEIVLVKEENGLSIRIHAIAPSDADASIIATVAAADCRNRLERRDI